MADRGIVEWRALLSASPFAGWDLAILKGDASGRRYGRLSDPKTGGTAILMDMGGEAPEPFLRIAAHLGAIGLSVPEILWSSATEPDVTVISDLGRSHFADWIAAHPGEEQNLYSAAVQVIRAIQSNPPPPGLVSLTPKTGAAMIAPLFEWFLPDLQPDAERAIEARVQEALAQHAPVADVLSLRDYHAENLIWRPERQGLDRVGILDFQDAFLAPPEYDLVSLLRDARRDVSDPVQTAVIAAFCDATGRDGDRVRAAFAVLAVQRNLRILGIFSRLARRDGKTRYLGLLPRVLAQLRADLEHPALAALQSAVLPVLERTRIPS